MNPRIRDLALEALVENIASEGWVFTEEELERFAQLIVRECATVASMNNHQWDDCGSYVLRHFGVENAG